MTKKVKEYNKLPGYKKGFLIGKYTLWHGSDHLLHIFARFGVEDYKRYYFSDIQAIIARKTITGKVQNIITGCLTLLFLIPFFMVDGPWSIFYVIVSAIFFIILLINLYLGPTCDTRLMTAVQTEKLQSLHRLKTASRVISRIRPHIHESQGILSREDLTKIPSRPGTGNIAQRPVQAGAPVKEVVKHENGRVHMILFALLMVDGVLVTSEFFISHVVPTIFSSVASLCIGIFVIVALVRQHNSDLPGALRAITWTILGFVGVTFIMGYVVGLVFAFKNPGIAYNQWEIVKSISSLSPWDSPLKMSYNIVVICGALILAIPGMIMLRQNRSWGNNPTTATPAASRRTAASRTPETG